MGRPRETPLRSGLTRKLACSSVHFAAGRWTRSLRSLAISLNRLVPSSHRPLPSLISSPKQATAEPSDRARTSLRSGAVAGSTVATQGKVKGVGAKRRAKLLGKVKTKKSQRRRPNKQATTHGIRHFIAGLLRSRVRSLRSPLITPVNQCRKKTRHYGLSGYSRP